MGKLVWGLMSKEGEKLVTRLFIPPLDKDQGTPHWIGKKHVLKIAPTLGRP